MTGYELATRVNAIVHADRERKLSASQGEAILDALENDGSLAADLGKHLYGDPQPPPHAETETEPREILDIKDASNA